MSFFKKPIVLVTSVVATVVGGAHLIKEKVGGPLYEGTEKLTNKVVLITGCNQGIGKAVVQDLARKEAKIVMACRDLEKCEEARKEIVLRSQNKFIYCRKCDLASQESIKEFVDQFKKEHSRLDVLINNAGVMRCPKAHTKEGIEMQLGVNHMGHFLLTNLLLDTLKASAPARIINVSSVIYKRGKIYFHDFNSDAGYDPAGAYAQSKLANVLFTKKLAQQLKDAKVTVNAVYPGVVDTAINRHLRYYSSGWSYYILRPILWPFLKTPRHGAQVILFGVLDPSLENVSGKMLTGDFQINDISVEKNTDYWADWLWMTSEKWTGLG